VHVTYADATQRAAFAFNVIVPPEAIGCRGANVKTSEPGAKPSFASLKAILVNPETVEIGDAVGAFVGAVVGAFVATNVR
jgi:hypothetical protein